MGSGETLNAAMRSDGGDRLAVYLSSPAAISLRMDRITAGKTAKATWIDPRTGARADAGEFPAAGTRKFTPPSGWVDAILLVEAKTGRS
jgi:hypothetical protein